MSEQTVEVAAPKRPLSLAFAMFFCMVMALGGSLRGCEETRFHWGRDGYDVPLATTKDATEQERFRAFAHDQYRVLDQARRIRVPLSLANFLLSSLLLLAASRAAGGRAGSRKLAVQAITANAALAVTDYVVGREVRAQLVEVFVQHWPTLVKAPLPEGEGTPHAVVWLFFRLQLATILGICAAGYASLSTGAARQFLDVPEPVEEDDDEEP